MLGEGDNGVLGDRVAEVGDKETATEASVLCLGLLRVSFLISGR